MLCIEILEALDELFPSIKFLITLTPDDDLAIFEVDSYEIDKNKTLLLSLTDEEVLKRYEDNTIIPYILNKIKEAMHV